MSKYSEDFKILIVKKCQSKYNELLCQHKKIHRFKVYKLDGIGEYLDIEFKKPSDELQILNGFVDFRRKHLFKDNNRVKTILVESSEPKFSQEYELEDVAKYTSIKLPAKTSKVRITIKDVYPGSKWQDTCLSSILVTDPDLPPYSQQKARILQFMKEYGLWDLIQKYCQ